MQQAPLYSRLGLKIVDNGFELDFAYIEEYDYHYKNKQGQVIQTERRERHIDHEEVYESREGLLKRLKQLLPDKGVSNKNSTTGH